MQLFVPVQPHEKKAKAIKQWKKQNLLKSQKKKPENFFIATWKSFTKNTSIHAVHYLTESSITLMEKVIWACAIIIASAAMVYSCILLSNRFRTSLLSTVFESTNYKVTEIPFAGVTVCNNNRLNYNKTDAAIEKFFPNKSSTETETFVKFVRILQNNEFGSFDEFVPIEDENVTEIDKLNITEIYEFMMHDCEDFFVSCQWRNTKFNCCEWFSKQRTEYGVCWSFNSYTNVGSKFVNVSFKRVKV